MKRAHLICLIQLLTSTFLLSQLKPLALNQSASAGAPSIAASANAARPRILDSYGKLPLGFEANQGQTDARVKFLSRTRDYSLFLTADEAVLTLRAKAEKNATQRLSAGKLRFVSGPRFSDATISAKPDAGAAPPAERAAVLRMKLRNANPTAKVSGVDGMAGTSNYFIGNDPAKWKTSVATYAKVKYEGIYSGIDLVYYGNQRQLEYDFIVSPGADPHRIAFDIAGANKIRRDAQGDLVLSMSEGDIRWHKPVVYQVNDGARHQIAAHYAITNTNRVAFEVAKYDATKPLYIDPLIYSTYLGGSSFDGAYAIAVDSAGSAYVTGSTNSFDFPIKNAFQTTTPGWDAFVTKLDPTGSALVYSTYLGGNGGAVGNGIAVDNAGNAYVIGLTGSGFATMNPLQPNYGGGQTDAFVAKINAAGSALIYSTFLGGSGPDDGSGIAVDSAGNAYVTGGTNSTDFPTKNPFQAANGGGAVASNAFVAMINTAGSALVYSTYLGGDGGAGGSSIAVDSAGNAYVTGSAEANFPTQNAWQPAFGGGVDAFVTKFNPTGSALVYSSYLGGSGFDYGSGIAVDSSGDAYVTGSAGPDFPVTPGAFQTAYGGGTSNAFVSKINAGGSALVYSTYLGGNPEEEGLDR
jgi:Beta-propeller repeat